MPSWTENIPMPAIVVAIGALIATAGAFRASFEQSKSEKELRKKNEEIASLNRQIAQTGVGGDSYCYVDFSYNAGFDYPFLTLIHVGDYPLYDVSIVIRDLDEYEYLKDGTPTIEDLEKAEFSYPSRNLSPGERVKLYRLPVSPSENRKRYEVSITSRNGSVKEFVTDVTQWRGRVLDLTACKRSCSTSTPTI
jgi:hypothetical protein